MFVLDLARATKDIIKYKANLEGYCRYRRRETFLVLMLLIVILFVPLDGVLVNAVADNLRTLSASILTLSFVLIRMVLYRKGIRRPALAGNRAVVLGPLVSQR